MLKQSNDLDEQYKNLNIIHKRYMGAQCMCLKLTPEHFLLECKTYQIAA